MKQITFANDLTILVRSNDKTDLVHKVNEALATVKYGGPQAEDSFRE